MSDTEEGGFDKEAEKEKLREQFRREEAERRSTQHMSELLLKGATMTNKHCDTCGDPLFRYEGREFCPSCSQEGAADAQADAANEAGTSVAERGARGDPGAPGDEAAPEGGPEPTANRSETETDEPAGRGGHGGGGEAARAVDQPPIEAGREGDVGEARDALVRKLTTLAAQAEATDDVGRSRELLAAAREAAEALAAIGRVPR